MLNYTIWTYCPDNSHTWGDQWNGEDLTLWSADDAACQGSKYREKSSRYGRTLSRPCHYHYGARSNGTTPNASNVTLLMRQATLPKSSPMELDLLGHLNLNDGARALAAFCRPYPIATVGEPVYFNFDIGSASFELTVEVTSADAEHAYSEQLATEIYVPAAQFGAINGSTGTSLKSNPNSSTDLAEFQAELGSYLDRLQIEVTTSGGRWETEGQILRWYYPRNVSSIGTSGSDSVRHTIKVRRKSGPILYEHDTFW